MLNETLFRVPRTSGLQLLQRRGEHGAHELTSWRLRLDAGGSERYASPDEETVVVLQQGRGAFEVGGHRWTVARAGVFSERATALYLPPGSALTVRARHGRGFGVTRVLRHHDSAAGIMLETHCDNGPARRLYTAAGWDEDASQWYSLALAVDTPGAAG